MKTNKIRITPLIKEIKEKTNLIQSKLKETPEYARVNSYMNAGTEIRSGTGKGDVLALSVVANIHSQRPTKDTHLNIKEKIKRIAHIVQSLKHPDEVQRKDNKGKTIAWDPKKAQVSVQLRPASYIDREARATKEIKQILGGKL